MLAQKRGGSIVSITTPMVDHPIAGLNASVAIADQRAASKPCRRASPWICEGADPRQHGRAGRCRHAAAQDNPKDFLKTLSPISGVSNVREIVDAVLF